MESNSAQSGNALVICPDPNITAAFLSDYALEDPETQVVITSSNSPFEKALSENIASEPNAKLIDLNDPISPDCFDFFSGASSTEAIETVDQLFDIRKGDEDVLYKHLTATVLYAVVCYLNSKDGHISVEGICTIAGLFFENPLGDEKEYSSRLDELIETYQTGVHIKNGNHKKHSEPMQDEELSALWKPVRLAFKDAGIKAGTSTFLNSLLRTYRGHTALDDEHIQLDEAGNTSLISIPGYDRSNDVLFRAIMDKLLSKRLEKGCNASAETRGKLKMVVEEYENKPSIQRLIDVISAARFNDIGITIHCNSVAGFCGKFGSYANEAMNAFDSLIFLGTSETAALQEIQLRTGKPLHELFRWTNSTGWMFTQGKAPKHITISNDK